MHNIQAESLNIKILNLFILTFNFISLPILHSKCYHNLPTSSLLLQLLILLTLSTRPPLLYLIALPLLYNLLFSHITSVLIPPLSISPLSSTTITIIPSSPNPSPFHLSKFYIPPSLYPSVTLSLHHSIPPSLYPSITLSLHHSIPPSESIPRAVVGLMQVAGGRKGYEDKLVALFINKTTEIDRYTLDNTNTSFLVSVDCTCTLFSIFSSFPL
jgi:hypothetical protein